jgi:hypothetical protein
MVFKSQADYGAKLASAPAALRRLLLVGPYLFPEQWLLLAAIGLAGWVSMLKSRYWLAGPIAGPFLTATLYVMATKTVPYDRTFGLWIIFAIMGCAWLWKLWLASPRLGTPAICWLPAIAAATLFVSGVLRLASDECRLYLPDDPGFLKLSDASPKSVYLLCKSIDPRQDGFRCTYYQRNTAEWVNFQIPESWRACATWRNPNYSILRLNASVTTSASSILSNTPQIAIWRAANQYFDLDRYINERLVNNPTLPLFHFVKGYFFPTPTLIFFLNGDDVPFRKVLSELDATTPGSVLVLTPKG